MVLRLERTDILTDPRIWLGISVVVPVTIALFLIAGIYRPVVRYISAYTFARITVAMVVAAGVMFAISRSIPLPIPRSVPAIWLLLSIGGIAASRFTFRSLIARTTRKRRTPVLIWGAGDIARELVSNLLQGNEYRPVGMIDPNAMRFQEEVLGVRVFQTADIPALMENLRPKHVLVALDRANAETRQSIVDRFSRHDVEIFTIPRVSDIVSGRASVSQVRAMKIEDLLGREPVAAVPELMGKTIAGRVVMVTGAGGSIGSELCRQIAEIGPSKLVLFEVSEYALYEIDMELRTRLGDCGFEIIPVLGSVLNEDYLRLTMKRHKVQTIYHAAAYKHVPLVEDNVVSAIRNNVFGTRATARAALAAGATSFTLVSTDKAVRPTNVMGASKRVAELYCQSLAETSDSMTTSMVRFGNVLGSSGSVIPRFRQQLQEGKPLTVTDPDITRYFMTIPEAAQLVIQSAGIAKGGDTFLLDMGEPIRIVDLAARMIRLSGSEPFVRDPATAANLGLPDHGEVEITFTGLRPGEKLFEELLIDEDALETRHTRIMRANECKLTTAELDTLLTGLEANCMREDETAIRTALLECKPVGYRPNATTPTAAAAEGADKTTENMIAAE